MEEQGKKPSVEEILNEIRSKRQRTMAEASSDQPSPQIKPALQPKEPVLSEEKTDIELQRDKEREAEQIHRRDELIRSAKAAKENEKNLFNPPRFNELDRIADNEASRSFIENYFSSPQKEHESMVGEADDTKTDVSLTEIRSSEDEEEAALQQEEQPPEEFARPYTENTASQENVDAPAPETNEEDPDPESGASEDHEIPSLKENRLNKIKEFVLAHEDEDTGQFVFEEDEETDSAAEEDGVAGEEITEYNSDEEASSVKADIDSVYSRLIVRFLILLVPTLFSLYLTFAPALSLPLSETLNVSVQPMIVAFITVVLLTLSSLVSLSVLSEGFRGLFHLKANSDSILALATSAALIQNVAAFTDPSSLAQGKIHLYSAVVITGLLFNTLGKITMIKRVRHNFRFISSPDEKYGNVLITDHRLTTAIQETTGYQVSAVCIQKKASFVTRFLSHSYSSDPSDRISKWLSLLFLLGAFVIGGMIYYTTRSGLIALSSFTATLVISAPLTSLLVSNLPLYSECRKLFRWGATISGYSAVSEIEKADSAVLRDFDLLPAGSVTIHGIKTFGDRPIDQTILYTVSAMHFLQNSLTDVLMQIIEGNKSYLKNVESAVYTDDGGIEAWIASHRVHIGVREQFKVHDIDVPSRDFEEKYCKKGRQAFYVAVNGEIAAMIVISYKPRKDIVNAVRKLCKLGITIFVTTTDPNLSDDLLTDLYDLKPGQIEMLPAALSHAIDKYDAAADSRIVHKGSFESFAWAMCRAIRLKWNIDIGTVIQTVGSVGGFALAVLLSLMSGVGQLDSGALLLYQFSWLVLIVSVQRII